MRKRLIAGNWKLNGDWTLCQQMVSMFASHHRQHDIVVCPPAVYLSRFAELIAAQSSQISVGAQDVSSEISGAYTGEIAANMLAESGVQYGIVGHSERRQHFAETDTQVAEKMLRLLAASITPIVCVGEALEVRDAGASQALAHIEAQLLPIIEALSESTSPVSLDGICIAYEPIWAIGTGRSAIPEQAQEVHAHIRAVMQRYADADQLRILYGGSVNKDNAQALLAMQDIDGALVGGASLDPQHFAMLAL